MRNPLLDGFVESISFVSSIDEDHNLLSVHDSSYSNSQGSTGDLRDVVVEESSIGLDCFHSEGLDSGSGRKTASRFVESHMSIRTNS